VSKKPNGKADNRLRAGPGLPDAGFTPHPAIATDENPELYDPRRAVGAEKARGFATGHGVRLAPEKAASSVLAKPKSLRQIIKHKRIGAQEAYSQLLQDAQERRKLAVLEYETGVKKLGVIAKENNVTTRTIQTWANQVRRRSVRLSYARADENNDDGQNFLYVPGIQFDVGGRMTDREAQDATRKLEIKIVALQAKLGWLPFEYRKEAEA
jgi:hypothetical protein